VIEAAAEFADKYSTAGRQNMLCGNGGSAADCQHYRCRNLWCVMRKTPRQWLRLPWTTDSSILTAHAMIFWFETVFSRQIEALGN